MLTRQALETLAKQAGERLRGYFGRVRGQQKADHSLVSEADRETEAFLLEAIRKMAPSLPILAEESFAAGERPDASGQEWLLAIDPLDGTTAFLSGLPVWGVSLGLLRKGIPVRSALYFPMIEEMYTADEEGAWWGTRRLSRAPFEVIGSMAQASMCMPSNMHRAFSIDFAGKNRNFGTSAYHLALVARGAVIGTLLERVCLWDVAGGFALCAHTGREVAHFDGRPFSLEKMLDGSLLTDPILIADPQAMPALQGTIRHPG